MFGQMRNRWNSVDATSQLVLVAILVFGAVVLIPRIPAFSGGVDCEGMGQASVTGNNQSILGRREDPANLTLELTVEKNAIVSGESLVLWVRFNNSSLAPYTILMRPDEAVFRYTGQEVGINFAVLTANGQPLGEPAGSRPAAPLRTVYAPADMRLLSPRSRCNVRIEISAARLASARIGQGDYRITAIYRNTQPGQISPPSNAQTPTPVFPTQGVWNGEVRSNEVQISVRPAVPFS
ncbi:MAG TPA: hypothetical protein PLD47_08225 [Aggregatilineales bacterium]|nr:hypothetical protein [Anaerolineales bacterium]HRE47696.1 hypothetical protein [Aggregatilineales bacterium]